MTFIPFADWQSEVKTERFKRSATRAELAVMVPLRQRGFVFQYPIGKYVVDFCHPDKKIIIELDGDVHYTDAATQVKDARRDRYLTAQGYRTLRFTNETALRFKCDILKKVDK